MFYASADRGIVEERMHVPTTLSRTVDHHFFLRVAVYLKKRLFAFCVTVCERA